MTPGGASDARAHAESTLAAIAAVQAEIDADLAASAVEDAKREEEFAADARTGKLGPEWQRVQQRIDLGETTVDDVMSGADDSPSARALRERAQSRLATIHDELLLDDDGEREADPLTQVNDMQRDLVKRIEELQKMTEGLDGQR